MLATAIICSFHEPYILASHAVPRPASPSPVRPHGRRVAHSIVSLVILFVFVVLITVLARGHFFRFGIRSVILNHNSAMVFFVSGHGPRVIWTICTVL